MTGSLAALRPLQAPRRTIADLLGFLGDAASVGTGGSGDPMTATWSGLSVTTGGVIPGDLFVALAGLRAHGAQFAQAAWDNGAAAVLTDTAGFGVIRDSGLLDEMPDRIVVVVDPGETSAWTVSPAGLPAATPGGALRQVTAAVADWFYGHPSAAMTTIGVTGTNGKTTTSFLIDAALAARFPLRALIGTITTRIGEESIASQFTTGEAPVLQAALARAREAQVSAATLEVSSHALALSRVAGTAFAVVAFTNLQRDHLDFHQDMEHYFAAKAQLFTPAYARRGVVMVDDEWGRRLAQTAAIPIETVSATPASEGYEHATWRVTEQRVDQETLATSFTLAGPGGVTVSATVQLPGSVNVANAALAIVTAHAAGVSWHDSAAGVAGVAGVPGRMERIDDPVSSGPRVIVDFAHTPDAIELIAGTTRTLAHGRLVVVVGATGQRDAGKRPLMGAAAAHWADEVVVTDDDPHGEDPGPIREQVAQGARQAAAEQGRAVAVRIVAPRAVAIRTAIRDAADADTVLILGRGHEVIQEIDGVDYALDDRVEAREALNLRADGDGGSL